MNRTMTKKATNPDLASLNLKATPAEELDTPIYMARNVATNAQVHASVAMQPWMKHVYGDIALNELVAKLHTQTDAMQGGDMQDIEAMLFNQALTLQTMFTALSRRAALNAGEYMGATDTYMKLVFKAQAQFRSTLEALAEIKQPRLATFVRQANIAHTRQVNHGLSETTTRTRARDFRRSAKRTIHRRKGNSWQPDGHPKQGSGKPQRFRNGNRGHNRPNLNHLKANQWPLETPSTAGNEPRCAR